MASRFRIFHTTIALHPDLAAIIVNAAVALHNMLREKSRETYCPPGFADEVSQGTVVEGEWRNEDPLISLEAATPQNCTLNATQHVREKFAESIDWQ